MTALTHIDDHQAQTVDLPFERVADPASEAQLADRRKSLFVNLAVAVGVLALTYAAWDQLVAARHVTTDNAYVGADMAQVTPLVGAPVRAVLVKDSQVVHKGDVLVRLDDTDARIALARAEADLQQTERRVRALSATDAGLNAQIAARAADRARATRDQARADLDRMVLRAPFDGVVSHRHVQVGQRVQAGQSLMVVVPDKALFVDANYKEGQLAQVRPGQPVTLTSDLYGSAVTYHGRVMGLTGGTGAAFAVAPAQNATGNWIKVVQRLPVRIALDAHELAEHPLRVGLPMNADIEVAP